MAHTNWCIVLLGYLPVMGVRGRNNKIFPVRYLYRFLCYYSRPVEISERLFIIVSWGIQWY